MSYRSIFRNDLFKGAVMVVTGGGSGIGRCTAHELAHLGATVAIIGRQESKLITTKQEIEEYGGSCTAHVCDIRDEELVKNTVSSILGTHNRLDGLINNAGGQFASPLAEIKGKGWEAVIKNNLTGSFLVSRECYTQWMSKNGGAIVNVIADIWLGMPNMGHSGAARAGMLNFTETAALEWAPVRVNAVAPGWIASSGMDNYPKEMQEQAIQLLPKMCPANRLGTESEVSAAIVFLLSPAAAFISGSCLRVDGAAPNAKRIWGPLVGSGKGPEPFDGFQLARGKKL